MLIVSGSAAASSGSSCRRRSRFQASRSAAIVAAGTRAAFSCRDFEGSSPRPTRLTALTRSWASA